MYAFYNAYKDGDQNTDLPCGQLDDIANILKSDANMEQGIQHSEIGLVWNNQECEISFSCHIQDLFYACCGQFRSKVWRWAWKEQVEHAYGKHHLHFFLSVITDLNMYFWSGVIDSIVCRVVVWIILKFKRNIVLNKDKFIMFIFFLYLFTLELCFKLEKFNFFLLNLVDLLEYHWELLFQSWLCCRQ